MAEDASARILGGVVLAVAGVVAALLLGAPLVAALVALVAGLAALAVARAGNGEPPAPDEVEETPDAPPPVTVPDARSLLPAVDEPMLLVRDRRILVANPAARALLGHHIEGVDVRLAIRHPAAAARLVAPIDPERGPERAELDGIGAPGQRWDMVSAPLPGEEGGLLVRLIDRSAAHAAEKMRVDFVANASHELRTPLAAILGFIETLQDETAGDDRTTRARFLAIMQDEAQRMRGLLDDLMSLSRIEADRFLAPRGAVPLLPLIDEVKDSLARQIAERKAGIAVTDTAGAPVVEGDRPQLAQLFHNLLSNALKYGRAGGAVTVTLEGADGMVRVRVADEGEGIAAEHLPRLTERFYRADPGRSRAVGGTGLGLAIVKHIVGRHRGRLDIASTPGVGTVVSVLLPRAESPSEPLSSKSHASVTQSASKAP